MPNNVYECMYILDANAYARNPGGASENIQQMVEKTGGELLASRLWNEQKLAYPIKGRHKGAYWLSYFRIESNKLQEFNRACQLNDFVLRHLVVKIDPRLVDTLVSVAKGGVQPEVSAEVEEKSKESKEADDNDSSTGVDNEEVATVDG